MAPAEVADIFRIHGPSYRETHKLPLNQLRTMHAGSSLQDCGLGGSCRRVRGVRAHKDIVQLLQEQALPQVPVPEKEKWVEARARELLPIEYFHVVFTLPAKLRSLALRNSEVIYNILFKAASETLADCARTRLGVQIGSTDILHTWGQNLMNHPHVHCIVTGGGLSQGTWISSKRRFLFPVKVLSPLFKGKFLFFLRKAYEAANFRVWGRSSRPF